MESPAHPDPPVSYRARVRLALILLLLIALLSSRELLRLTTHGQAGGSEAVAYMRRFDEVKKILPTRGVICYLPDPRIETNTVKEYFLAQYALAPLVLRNGNGCDLLIANFPNDRNRSTVNAPNYLVVQDVGNGVTLFRKVR